MPTTPTSTRAILLLSLGAVIAGLGMTLTGQAPIGLLWLAPPVALGLIGIMASRAQLRTQMVRQAGASAMAAERATREAAARSVQEVINALPEPVILIDADQRVAALNTAALELFGAGAPATPLSVYMRHPAVIEAASAAAGIAEPVEREVVLRAGVERAFRVRCGRIDQAGTLLMMLQDTTQARLTERMRVDFVANASHELRTPLSTLTGFIETLQGKAIEDVPTRTRFLEIMASESHRMSRLIDDLLSLSRVEMDKHVRPGTPVDLMPLLKDVGRTLAIRLEAGGRQIRLATPQVLPQVIADHDQILQVLHNLVSNALKYGHADSPIELTAALVDSAEGRYVEVSVRDHGDGIDPEHLPRLTERFYRVDTARSRSMGGTGLGLAIVKHIIERHRGTLTIKSVIGEGTTVSFTLPVAHSRTAA